MAVELNVVHLPPYEVDLSAQDFLKNLKLDKSEHYSKISLYILNGSSTLGNHSPVENSPNYEIYKTYYELRFEKLDLLCKVLEKELSKKDLEKLKDYRDSIKAYIDKPNKLSWKVLQVYYTAFSILNYNSWIISKKNNDSSDVIIEKIQAMGLLKNAIFEGDLRFSAINKFLKLTNEFSDLLVLTWSTGFEIIVQELRDEVAELELFALMNS